MYFNCDITNTKLPAQYRNAIAKDTSEGIVIRSNLFSIKDIDAWVREFSIKAKTRWIVRNTVPKTTCKLVAKKTYVCHHSSFNKADVNEENRNHRGVSKSTKCLAKMTLKVKPTTRNTKKKDPFVKDGLPAVILISKGHNHSLESPSTLKHLPPLNSVQRAFHRYFDMGMNPTGACKFHESSLLVDNDFTKGSVISDENIIQNAQYNPTKRTVSHWFARWKRGEFDLKEESDLDEKISNNRIEQSIENITLKYEADENEDSKYLNTSFRCESSENTTSNAIHNDEDENEDDIKDDNISIIEEELILDDYDIDTRVNDKLEDIFYTIRELYKQYSSPKSEQGLDEFLTRLRHIESTDQFNKFLYHDS